MCRGHIQQIGTAELIQQNPATPFVASFIEDVNKFPSTCQVASLSYQICKKWKQESKAFASSLKAYLSCLSLCIEILKSECHWSLGKVFRRIAKGGCT